MPMRRTRKLTSIGMKIKMALIMRNMTVRELAGRIDRSEATVCDVISGKNRSARTRKRILNVLELPEE